MKKLPFIYRMIRGAIGKKFVIKHYRYGVVMTKFPDMSRIVASGEQRKCRDRFKLAVAYARSINKDPKLKKVWAKRVKQGTVYHAAIKAFMRGAVAIQSTGVHYKKPVTRPLKVVFIKGIFNLRVASVWPPVLVLPAYLRYRDTG